MWPCVAVSEICCFQLVRGLSKVAACPTTSHVPPPPPLHFLGSGFQPPQWDSSLGAGAPDWTFCEALGALRPPACLPSPPPLRPTTSSAPPPVTSTSPVRHPPPPLGLLALGTIRPPLTLQRVKPDLAPHSPPLLALGAPAPGGRHRGLRARLESGLRRQKLGLRPWGQCPAL